jgi:hypothetical protein
MPALEVWLREKAEAARQSGREQRRMDWVKSYANLLNTIIKWIGEYPEYFDTESSTVDQAEQGIGAYKLNSLRIRVGDSSVRILPLGRNVIARIDTGTGTSQRAAGGVDIMDEVGGRTYTLYRIIQDGQDVWYVMDERGSVTVFSKERFQEILMDLMS